MSVEKHKEHHEERLFEPESPFALSLYARFQSLYVHYVPKIASPHAFLGHWILFLIFSFSHVIWILIALLIIPKLIIPKLDDFPFLLLFGTTISLLIWLIASMVINFWHPEERFWDIRIYFNPQKLRIINIEKIIKKHINAETDMFDGIILTLLIHILYFVILVIELMIGE